MSKAKPPLTFDELQKLWYEKLKESGFVDAEQPNGMLKFWTGKSGSYAGKDGEQKAAVQNYYTFAEHFLNSHPFKNNLERTIWEYHANGLSSRDIANTLNRLHPRRKKTNHHAVNGTINRLKQLMLETHQVYGKLEH